MTDLPKDLRDEIDARVAAGEVTKLPAQRRGRKANDMARRRAEVRRLVGEGATAKEIVRELEKIGISVSAMTVQADKKHLGLTREYRTNGAGCKVTQKKRAAAEKSVARVSDRRRFKVTTVPFGEPSVLAPEDQDGPIFPDRVFQPDGDSELVLKDGCSNSKIGGDVLVGWLKGAYIATLTLPERTTCPRSCAMWRGCYGNSMHYARRFAPGQALEDQLRHEIDMACEKNVRVLIRLHVLGDFYSFDYLKLWAEMLDTYDNLYVFGFTAWKTDTEIGAGISRLRAVYPRRFMIRHSGAAGPWGSFTIPFPTDQKTIGDAIVCPEQLDSMSGSKKARHCGNCGVCWSTDRAVAFVEH